MQTRSLCGWILGIAMLLAQSVAPSALAADDPPASAQPPAATTFPHSWFGRWKGEAFSGTGGPDDQHFSMELIVGPTETPDEFQWTTVYDGPAGRQERKYVLRQRNAARGEYAVDEKNGIVIETRLLDGALYSNFLIQGTRIAVREKLEASGTPDEHISVEMVVTAEDQAVVSGNKDGAPEVKSWMPRSLQRAKLRRVQENDAPAGSGSTTR